MNKTIGFVISHKENENRRAIVPEHIAGVLHPEMLFIESGYGDVLGLTDNDYRACGCNIVSRSEALMQDIVCDPKIGDAEYLEHLHEGQIVFGWVHATQNKTIADKIINRKLTAYAWENMFYNGRHIFWRNNELAGEAAVMHACQCYGKMPYEIKAAVLGKGNTARGAIKVLNMLGAQVIQYDRHTEKLFVEELDKYDMVVNCILWDIKRSDHIIHRSDLVRMKRGAMIIDVSCDRNGGIETCIPTTISNPTYFVDNILHYAVDHTPSLFFKTFTWNNSEILVPFINELVGNCCGEILNDCVVIRNGEIIDKSIIEFQNRK